MQRKKVFCLGGQLSRNRKTQTMQEDVDDDDDDDDNVVVGTSRMTPRGSNGGRSRVT